MYAAFLQRKGGAAALTKAMASQKLPADVARIGVRTVRTSGREAPGLAEALTKAGGLTFGAKVLDAAELKAMVADVAAKGDAARGEAVFRRADQLCLKCHAIGGAGGQVGPDLSSIGAVAQVDYLIESLLQPSKAIKEGYHSLLVTTTRGRQLTGIRVRETPTTLVLRDDQDKEIAIPTKEIDEKTPSKVSLMPEGLTDTLTRARCSTSCGSCPSWARANAGRSAGRASPAAGKSSSRTRRPTMPTSARASARFAANPAGLAWEPVYSTVAGALPLAGLPALRPGKAGPATVDRPGEARGDGGEQGPAEARRQGRLGVARRRPRVGGRRADARPEAGPAHADARGRPRRTQGRAAARRDRGRPGVGGGALRRGEVRRRLGRKERPSAGS